MDDATVAVWLSRGRVGIGLTAVVAPRFAVRVLRSSGDAEGVEPMLARMAGARDLTLGLGTLLAIDKGAPVRGWLEGAALADAVDCLSALVARKQLSPHAFIGSVGLAASSAFLCAALSRRLDPAAAHRRPSP
jgi:hypothetical protein